MRRWTRGNKQGVSDGGGFLQGGIAGGGLQPLRADRRRAQAPLGAPRAFFSSPAHGAGAAGNRAGSLLTPGRRLTRATAQTPAGAGLDPDRGDELAFREEPWATVLSEVPLRSESVPVRPPPPGYLLFPCFLGGVRPAPASTPRPAGADPRRGYPFIPSPQDFLEAAARFCNGKLWGTLSAQLIIHPAQEREHREAFQRRARRTRIVLRGELLSGRPRVAVAGPRAAVLAARALRSRVVLRPAPNAAS